MRPIASGPGAMPDCVEGKRHVFLPGVTRCRCAATNRLPSPLGAITTPRDGDRKAQIA